MALPSAGNSISFKQINDELGNDSQAQLDLETAAETGFGLSKPHGLNEMFGLSLSRLEIVVRYMKLVVQDGPESGQTQYVGWADGDLDDCAGLDGSVEDDLVSIESENDFNEDGNVSNGDVIFANSTGTTKPVYASGNSDELQADGYLVETTQNNIFLYDKSDSDISNVISRTPEIPTKPTLVADSSTQITVTIPTTNTQVTKTFKIQRSINGASFSDLATITPSAKGNFANTSVNTTYVDSSGLSAGDVVKYQVRGQNDFTNSNFSQESNTVTTPTGTSISSSPTSELIILGSNSTTIGPPAQSGLLTVSITNRGSNTVAIARTQNTSGAFTVAYSTSGDPGTSGTANGGSGFGTGTGGSPLSSDTIYIRTQFNEGGKNVSEGPTNNTVDVTCNGVTLNINVSCRVTNF